MAKFTYTVWGLDVWGNESDGWETNDRWREGKVVIDDNWNDAEVIKALFDAGYLNTAGARHFEVGGDEFMLTVDRAKNGRPLLTLEREGAGDKARKRRGGKPRFRSSRYWTVIVPPVPYAQATEWHDTSGRAATLSRGAFAKKTEATKWAEDHLRGAPYSLRKIGGAGGKRRKARSGGSADLIAAAKALKQAWR